MKNVRILLVIALTVAVVVAVGVGILYAVRPTPELGGQPDNFTIGTAIVIVGYFMFPILVAVAASLLFIALLLLLADAMQRRRARREVR